MDNIALVRLIQLEIEEPLPGRVLPEIAAVHGAEEAALRYRAIVLTTLRQLRYLSDARIRLLVSPEDGEEAVRFWLLPRLSDRWHAKDKIYTTDGWEIDFGHGPGDFTVTASADILCPNLSARWIHAGLLGLGRTAGFVLGPATGGGHYFLAKPQQEDTSLPERILPELPVIHSQEDWEQALDSPLGATLKKAVQEETP